MKKANFKILLAIGILSGSIIGAGIFSLPYVFQSAGLATGFFYLALAALVYIFVGLMYADVIARTSENHRFVGYAKIYLNRKLYWLSILMTIVQTILVLTIYLILSQSFANLITDFGHGVEKMIVFWFIGSLFVFLGLRRIAIAELLITISLIAIIILIFISGFPNLNQISVSEFAPKLGGLLIPLGAVLFSMAGRVAIPTMMKITPNVKKPIIWGTIIPVVVYGLFVLSILALSPVVTQDAVSGLIGSVPGVLLIAIGILGILSLLSSYITIGFDVYKSLSLDLSFPFWLQFLIIVFAPLGLYFAGFQNFIGLVGIVGGVFLALEGILMVMMWLSANKISKKPPVLIKKAGAPIAIFVVVVFASALIYELFKSFG